MLKKIIIVLLCLIAVSAICSLGNKAYVSIKKAYYAKIQKIYFDFITEISRSSVRYYNIFYNPYSNRYDLEIIDSNCIFHEYDNVRLDYLSVILEDIIRKPR